jgi:hypothetical protein
MIRISRQSAYIINIFGDRRAYALRVPTHLPAGPP